MSDYASTGPTGASPGYYVSGFGATSQTKTSPGYYAPGIASSSQFAAQPGYYAAAGASAPAQTAPGYYTFSSASSAPIAAPPGTYVSTAGATHVTVTQPGSYAAGYGNTGPTPAPPGSYVDTAGAGAPTLVAAGYFLTGYGNMSLAKARACPSGTASYGGASACRAGVYSGPDTVVGKLTAALASNGDFGTVAVGDTGSITFQIGDLASANANGAHLTDITLLGAHIEGGDGAFSLAGFTPGTVLESGDSYGFSLLYRGTTPAMASSAMLVLDTDQYAAFGGTGRSFSYALRALTGDVPEPATWATMIFGFGAVGAALRRRRERIAGVLG